MAGKGFFVTGTGTGVGKSLVSVGLCLRFQAPYWKPVQSGEPGDSAFAKAFLPLGRVRPSAYSLKAPIAPHQAAEGENIRIETKAIKIPPDPFLIVEGAGGVLVPLNERENMIDLMKHVALPVIVTALSGLGTLNHSFLTLSALRAHGLKIAGVILSGPLNVKNKRDIEERGSAPVLLEIPPLSKITAESLSAVFKNIFIP